MLLQDLKSGHRFRSQAGSMSQLIHALGQGRHRSGKITNAAVQPNGQSRDGTRLLLNHEHAARMRHDRDVAWPTRTAGQFAGRAGASSTAPPGAYPGTHATTHRPAHLPPGCAAAHPAAGGRPHRSCRSGARCSATPNRPARAHAAGAIRRVSCARTARLSSHAPQCWPIECLLTYRLPECTHHG